MSGRIYSIGYEGMTLEGFVDQVATVRVRAVVDVRLNPISRKPGFSRKRLSEALGGRGIEYVHEKALGNPQDNRDPFRSGNLEAGRERMRQILVDGGEDAIDRVVELATSDRIAVLCFERDHRRCHRDVVIEMAQERNPAIEVLHVR